MEIDRYERNHKVFIIAMISMIMSLALLGFVLYMLPYLMFDWVYNVPGFISAWEEWLIDNYNYSDHGARRFLLFISVLLDCFFIIIAYLTANTIEKQIFKSEIQYTVSPTKKNNNVDREGLNLSLKIIFIIFVVFSVGMFFEWLF